MCVTAGDGGGGVHTEALGSTTRNGSDKTSGDLELSRVMRRYDIGRGGNWYPHQVSNSWNLLCYAQL